MMAVRASKRVSMKESPNQFVGYSNVVAVNISAEETILLFGLREHQNPDQANSVAKLYISPAHAKRLAKTLAGVIETYEETFGEIIADPLERMSPEARAKIENQLKG